MRTVRYHRRYSYRSSELLWIQVSFTPLEKYNINITVTLWLPWVSKELLKEFRSALLGPAITPVCKDTYYVYVSNKWKGEPYFHHLNKYQNVRTDMYLLTFLLRMYGVESICCHMKCRELFPLLYVFSRFVFCYNDKFARKTWQSS